MHICIHTYTLNEHSHIRRNGNDTPQKKTKHGNNNKKWTLVDYPMRLDNYTSRIYTYLYTDRHSNTNMKDEYKLQNNDYEYRHRKPNTNTQQRKNKNTDYGYTMRKPNTNTDHEYRIRIPTTKPKTNTKYEYRKNNEHRIHIFFAKIRYFFNMLVQ